MKKISASDARMRLKESRAQRSEERKAAEIRKKAALAFKRNEQKCLSEIFDRALTAALDGQSSIKITEDEHDLIIDQLENLGFEVEEFSARVKTDLRDNSSGELLKLAKKLDEALRGIKRGAIQFGKSDYCDMIDEYESIDIGMTGLKSTVALRIDTLGAIRDHYKNDMNVSVDFDRIVGTCLAQSSDILDRYYDGEIDEEDGELIYQVAWSVDSDDSIVEPSAWSANKLFYISSSSAGLFDCLENGVNEAVENNKSYFYLSASADDGETEFTFPDQTAITAPLSPVNLARVLTKQGFKCEVLTQPPRQASKRLKVSF